MKVLAFNLHSVIACAPMLTRILKVHLGEHLERLASEIGKSKLAKEIGVSAQKLTAMMNDDWQYITRDALERTADYLGLGADEVFEFVSVDFWKPIEQTNGVTFLRGSSEKRGDNEEFQMPWYDDQATEVVGNLLRELLPNYDQSDFADHGQDRVQLIERARQQNCIVIGSPKSNAACEILLCEIFGAEPFDPSPENRNKIPFGFCWEDNNPIVERSSLACSDRARKDTKGRPGIALKSRIHVAANYFTDAAIFRKWKTKSGQDCGLVFVANKPFGAVHNVKLIVLAGFSGVGTVAAAKALTHDFRYLEPQGTESYVYGVVAATYSKNAHNNHRELIDFKWKFRKNGRWPIRPEKTDPPKPVQIERSERTRKDTA